MMEFFYTTNHLNKLVMIEYSNKEHFKIVNAMMDFSIKNELLLTCDDGIFQQINYLKLMMMEFSKNKLS